MMRMPTMHDFNSQQFEELYQQFTTVKQRKKKVLKRYSFMFVVLFISCSSSYRFFQSYFKATLLISLCLFILSLCHLLYIDIIKQRYFQAIEPYLVGAQRIITRNINEQKYNKKSKASK